MAAAISSLPFPPPTKGLQPREECDSQSRFQRREGPVDPCDGARVVNAVVAAGTATTTCPSRSHMAISGGTSGNTTAATNSLDCARSVCVLRSVRLAGHLLTQTVDEIASPPIYSR